MNNMFKIVYSNKVLKDIQQIDGTILSVIKKAIEKKLTTHPDNFGKPLRNTLKNLWSLRVGDYRVIYKIKNKELIVLVVMIGSRDDVYLDILKRISRK